MHFTAILHEFYTQESSWSHLCRQVISGIELGTFNFIAYQMNLEPDPHRYPRFESFRPSYEARALVYSSWLTEDVTNDRFRLTYLLYRNELRYSVLLPSRCNETSECGAPHPNIAVPTSRRELFVHTIHSLCPRHAIHSVSGSKSMLQKANTLKTVERLFIPEVSSYFSSTPIIERCSKSNVQHCGQTC